MLHGVLAPSLPGQPAARARGRAPGAVHGHPVPGRRRRRPRPAKRPTRRARRVNCYERPEDGARLHVDAANLGPSYIFACGDFEGGGLWTVDGVLDVRGRWQRFDGRSPHATLPFEGGPRYSLVFYVRRPGVRRRATSISATRARRDAARRSQVHKRFDELAPQERTAAEELDFVFPVDDYAPAPDPPTDFKVAQRAFDDYCRHTPGIPDGWARA